MALEDILGEREKGSCGSWEGGGGGGGELIYLASFLSTLFFLFSLLM